MVWRKLQKVYGMFLIFHLPRKLAFFMITYFVLKVLGIVKTLQLLHFLGFIAFFIAYTSIYFINDLMDYEYDKKRKHLAYDKPLVTLGIDPKVFAFLGYFHAVTGLSLAFICSTTFGAVLAFTLLLAHIRSLFKGKISRTFLLFVLESFNFASFATILTGNLSSILKALAILAPVAVFYSFGYRAYREPEKRNFWLALSIFSFLILFTAAVFVLKVPWELAGIFYLMVPIFGVVNTKILSTPGRNFEKKQIFEGISMCLAAVAVYLLAQLIR